jgi:hypothetical protein
MDPQSGQAMCGGPTFTTGIRHIRGPESPDRAVSPSGLRAKPYSLFSKSSDDIPANYDSFVSPLSAIEGLFRPVISAAKWLTGEYIEVAISG